MSLNPPLCLEVTYSNVAAGANPNEYTATFTTPGQSYNGGANYYYCTDLSAGMWTSNSGNGYAFRIKTLSSVTLTTCDVVLEDVSGYNAIADPTGAGGGPADNTIG